MYCKYDIYVHISAHQCIYRHIHAAHNRIRIDRIINAFSRHSTLHFRTLHRSVLTPCRKVPFARMHINKDPGIFSHDTWTRYIVRALFRFRSFLRSFFNANKPRCRILTLNQQRAQCADRERKRDGEEKYIAAA